MKRCIKYTAFIPGEEAGTFPDLKVCAVTESSQGRQLKACSNTIQYRNLIFFDFRSKLIVVVISIAVPQSDK